MKTFICLFLLAALISSIACKHCESNSDCEVDECCVQWNDFLLRDTNCKKLGKEGDPCHRREGVRPKYKYYCNCGPGLKCKLTTTGTNEGGKEIAVYRCARP